MVRDFPNPRTSEAWPESMDSLNDNYTGVSRQRRDDNGRDRGTAPLFDVQNLTNSVHLYVSLHQDGAARTSQQPADHDYYNCRNFNEVTNDGDYRSDIKGTGYVNYSGSTENLLNSSNDALPTYTDVLPFSVPRPRRV
jgi:hypothetical protein